MDRLIMFSLYEAFLASRRGAHPLVACVYPVIVL